MKLTANHDAVIIETEITKDAYSAVVATDPKALAVIDEDKNPIFGIAFNPRNGGFDNSGVCFDKVANDGKLFYSFLDRSLPKESGKQRAYLEKTYGNLLINLKTVEEQVGTAAAAREIALAEIVDTISTDVE